MRSHDPRLTLGLACLYTWTLGSLAASAHTSPANCNGNGVIVNVSRSPKSVVPGGSVSYNISVANLNDPAIGLVACDVEHLDVVFYCPGIDGQPDFTNPRPLTNQLSLAAESPSGQVGGTQMCVLNVNPGVFDAVADVRAGDQSGPLDNLLEGSLHDADADHVFRIEKQLGTTVASTGGSSTSTTSTTLNSPPDCSSATAEPAELWPAHRQLVDVVIAGVTDPDGDTPTVTVDGITQDEPVTGRRGAGHSCPDGEGVGSSIASLRAERIGRRDGRVYHVLFTAEDGRGGRCNGSVTVCVPRDILPGHACIDEGPLFDSTGPCP